MALVHVLSDLDDSGDGSKPWADFIFDITTLNVVRGADDAIEQIEFEMRATHETGEVGLKVYLPVQHWSGQADSEIPVFYGNVTLHSLGPLTDRLLRLYETWWNLPADSAPALSSLTALAVGLATDPRIADEQQMQLKLFFDPERPSDDAEEIEDEEEDSEYGELYLNFDLPRQRAWLKEKDEEYRKAVVGWLTGRIRRAGESIQ